MQDRTTNVSIGKGSMFIELLQLIFITLKLCGVIDWSWGWVLTPLWGSLILMFIVLMIFIVAAKSPLHYKDDEE